MLNESTLKLLKIKKPKASSSAFVFFGKEQRKKLQEIYPTESFQDISSRLGKLWNDLPKEEREYYEELSLIDKSRFKEEKRKYKEQISERLLKGIQEGKIQSNMIDQTILSSHRQVKTAMKYYKKYVILTSEEKSMKSLILSWNSLSDLQKIPFYQMEEENKKNIQKEIQYKEEIIGLIY